MFAGTVSNMKNFQVTVCGLLLDFITAESHNMAKYQQISQLFLINATVMKKTLVLFSAFTSFTVWYSHQ